MTDAPGFRKNLRAVVIGINSIDNRNGVNFVKKICPRLIALLLCLLLMTGVMPVLQLAAPALASRRETEARETIEKVAEVFNTAKPFHEELKQLVANLIEDDESDDEVDIDFDEFEAEVLELQGYVTQLDEMYLELSILPDDKNTSEGKTVLAAREYLILLKNMYLDLITLGTYSIDLYTAVAALEDLGDPDADLLRFASDWWHATALALDLMEKITPPEYMLLTHNDLIKHMSEFKDLGSDFYDAVEMDDPLRLNSCLSRLGRIERMFTRCFVNLIDDLDLQSRQAESRLDGPVQLLHDELERNLNLLKAA